MVPETISHYRILKKLGQGGMGEVYLAHDTSLDRTVAVKVLPAEVAADRKRMHRFWQEAKAAAVLSHPNVCVIHEVGETDDGRPFIVMEYVQGETLEARIGGRPLATAEAIEIGLQLADALAEAHANRIIHRDIKPSNIIITPRGQAKLLDFGLAKPRVPKVVSPDSDVTTQMKSEPGLVLGTVAYMSPEQALGHEVDNRSDIFSLGVVLYQMVTGRLPFRGDTQVAVFDAILHQLPTSPARLNPEVPIELEHIISKALEKDRDMRYQTASDLGSDLKRLKRDTTSGQAVALGEPAAARRWLYRRLLGPLGWLVLAVLLLLLMPSARRPVKKWLGFKEVPTEKHLVVLPFTSVGNNPSNRATCDGLVEYLTSKLTQLEQFQGSLWVVPAIEVWKRGVTSASEARRAFGVTLAVTGSMQRQGDRVRLTLNLVDAKNLRQLSSSVIDDRITNAAALQDEVVIDLAEMLELELQPQTRRTLAAGGTAVPSAYDFYLQGRGYLRRYERPENLDTAISLFRRALDADPGYALAYAKLGEACWRKYEASKQAQWRHQAEKNCQRAIELNDRLAPVHVTCGQIHTGTGRYEEAVQEFQQALQLDPVSADAYRGLARAYEALGRLDEAETTYQKAIQLRPSYWAGYNDLGAFYYLHGRYEDAVAQFRQVVALTPDNFWGYNNLGGLYFSLERWTEAIKMFERSIQIRPNYGAYSNLGTLYFYQARFADAARMYEKALALDDHDYRVWGNLASAYYWSSGERSKAGATYQRSAQMAEEERKVNPRDQWVLCDLAGYYAMLGQRGKALPLLEQALALSPDDAELMVSAGDAYEHLGERERALEWIGKALEHGCSPAEIERIPGLQQLRADARFERLLQRNHNKR